MITRQKRRFPIGAEWSAESGAHFRLWAPDAKRVQVVIEGPGTYELEPEPDGYFSGIAALARPGARYRFRLDDKPGFFPDPASRYQPDGPHGPSEIVDAAAFRWTDKQWPGVSLEGQVIYEMHIGTFTREGSWQAAKTFIPTLAETGITLLEIMPIAEFPGSFGWGYDGVDLFAPSHLYGKPDDMRSFVDAAHASGIGVILDVVFNHLGPDGNYLGEFSQNYFTTRYTNEWGKAINFDGPDSSGVREFFITNAEYWIDEFHFDGLRLDATQQIFDSGPRNIMAELTQRSREAAGNRKIIIIGENEKQESKLIRQYGLDALWNDDFHHTAKVMMTGRREAYYTDYAGTPQEFISALKWGFLYQGQHYEWQKQPRGTSSADLRPVSFVAYIQNHDQVANSAHGERVHELTSPGRFRAMTAILLLGPNTPLIFQGQEFCASTPFLFFADHTPELSPLVQAGRAQFLQQFESIAGSKFALDLPHDRATFEKSKLNQAEREIHTWAVALHRDLLRLRRADPVFRAQRSDWMHGAVLDRNAFVLRFFGGTHGDRLIVANLGSTLDLRPAPEPLLAPPEDRRWKTVWSSEDVTYGGTGYDPLDHEQHWKLCAECVTVLSTD